MRLFCTIILSQKPEIFEMANRVEAENRVAVQKARGGLAPILQLQMGPRRVAHLIQRIEEADTLVGNRVAAEQAEAVARGVQVVYEGTHEEHFVEIVIPG
jgi:hypothetical protein